MIVDTLDKYEKVSGWKVNKDKSDIYLHHKIFGEEVITAEVATGILSNEFPFIYIGCPIFYRRKQKNYYQWMVQRISSKLQAWKEKLLSYRERAILIKHIL